jgi:hypothetical protein
MFCGSMFLTFGQTALHETWEAVNPAKFILPLTRLSQLGGKDH